MSWRPASLDDILVQRVTDTSGNETALTNFPAVTGMRNYITSITAYNSSATAGTIDLKDGASGAVFHTIPIPAGGGAAYGFGLCPLKQPTKGTALYFDVSGALTTVTLSLVGFRARD